MRCKLQLLKDSDVGVVGGFERLEVMVELLIVGRYQ